MKLMQFHQSTSSKLRLSTALAAIATLVPLQAQAQDSASATTLNAEEAIVVEALKQGGQLLDTPATVKVVTQGDLTTANITSARDLGGIVPGFTFMQGTAGGSASFRGMGSNSADPAIEASVGGFADGIYLGHTRDFTAPLYDLQQVEFVTGTQSTLLGRNTSLGAVSTTSRRPSDVLSFDGSVGYTSEVGAFNARAGIDVPLGQSFAVRLVGYYNKEQGYIRNDFVGRSEQDVRDISGRMVLEGSLSDRVKLTAIYQHDSRRSNGQYLQLLNDPDGLGDFFSTVVLGLPQFDGVGDDQTINGSERLDPSDPAAPLPFDNQDGDRATAILEFQTAGGSTLTAQTGYMNWTSARRIDQDYTPALILDLIDDEDNEVFSQELRFNSPRDNRLTYTLGLYYYNNSYRLRRQLQSDLGENLDALVGVSTNSFSAFASGRYSFGEQFALLGGIRHNLEDKRANYNISGTLAATIAPVTLPSVTYNQTDYNFGAEFRPNPELLLYATYARGSKNGGFQAIPDDVSLAQYGTEVTRSIEVGAKYDLGRLGSIEIAAFDTKVDDFQASRLVTAPGFPLPVGQIANVNARTTGAEFNLHLKPAEGLGMSAAATYTNARFTDELISEVAPGVFRTEIADGMPLVRAPRWSGKFTVDYTVAITNSLQLSLNGMVRYQSEADLQFRASNAGVPVQKAHALVDLEARIGDPGAGWSLAIIGNNLTNVRYATFASDWLLAGLVDPSATPPYYGRRNRPRTITVQASMKF